MKCVKCGRTFKNQQYCPYCGAAEEYMKKRRRSVPLMILSVVLTFIFTVSMLMSLCIRGVSDESLENIVNNIQWSDFKTGTGKNTTLTEYVSGFIDDDRMTSDGIKVILDSSEMKSYISSIICNYRDVIFKDADFMKLSSDDIVEIVKKNESNITAVTNMPFNAIGDIIYNDIDKTMSVHMESYNEVAGGIFSGISLILIRFALSLAGIITQGVILLVSMILSAVNFKYLGNGLKAFGITAVIPSFITLAVSLLSGLILRVPVLYGLFPSFKKIFIKYSLIFTGAGAVIILLGILFVKLADVSDKSRFKKAEKKAVESKSDDYEDEYFEEKSETGKEKPATEKKKSIKSDSFSSTGKIPVVSASGGKVCHVCGHINSVNAKFCRKCGSEQK